MEVLRWLAAHPASTAADALDDLGLRMLSEQDLAVIVNRVVSSNKSLLANDRAKALGKMMNLVMGEVRGRADPTLVSELLRVRIERVLA